MTLPLTPLDPRALCAVFGVGVAGNFAGHLEQAGEAPGFVNVASHAEMPKGIFPWYVPGSDGFLGAFPLASDTLAIPRELAGEHLQIEPELGLLCDLAVDDEGLPTRLHPRWVGAFDDCSIRRAEPRKISENKNWGAASKGVATRGFAVSDIDANGELATFRIASFLRRGEQTHAYGTDSAVATYSAFGDELLEWLVDRLRNQVGSDDTPLEDTGAFLRASGCAQLLVGVGATRYEPYGESTFVEAGDDCIVVLYDSAQHDPAQVMELVAARRDEELTAASVLRQRAVATGSSERSA